MGGADEDVKSWPSFERRSPATSLSREPPVAKGPAFWRGTVAAEQRKARAKAGRGGRLHVAWADCCVCPWLRKAVYVLVTLALTLFFVLICLISAYVTTVSNMDAFMLRLGSQKERLAQAVRSVARGQRLSCEPCRDNWVQMADVCYLFTTEKMSWQECVDHCLAQNSNLFIGYTEGETVSLMLETEKWCTIQNKRLVPGRYWIGLMYNSTAQKWLWANGAYLHIRMSVAERKPLFPENICIQFHNGHADRKKCTHESYCLCKRRAP